MVEILYKKKENPLIYTTEENPIFTGKIRMIKSEESESQKWARCVSECKLLIMKRDKARIRICELALEAIGGTIVWGGGGHWTGHANQNTVSKFAIDIGINPRTLLEWLAVKRYVWDNLPKNYQDDFSWTAMAKTRRLVDCKRDVMPSKTKVKENYEKFICKSSKSKNVLLERYLKHIGYTLKTFQAERLDYDLIDKIEVICCDILSEIKKINRKRKDYDE